MAPRLHARIEHWPLARPFAISRGIRREAVTLVVELLRDGVRGRGEAVPYARFGETPDSAMAEVRSFSATSGIPPDRRVLASKLPAGAARNALDCAYWDLEAKESGIPVWQRAGLPAPGPMLTAYTIALGSPDSMAEQAQGAAARPLLKVKLGGDAAQEAARIQAVRQAAPDARLIVDANEGWSAATLKAMIPALQDAAVELVEQPLPEAEENGLASVDFPLPLCADESCRTRADLDRVAALYTHVNVKLDKTGGFSEALALCHAARERGLGVFVGCMMAGSLAVAPAFLLGALADYVDLDGPLYMRTDRLHGLESDGARLLPPEPVLWG